MPRSFLMSPDFDGRHARWRKTYKGKPYSVTCAELGLPEAAWTELGSYQAANEWWKKRRGEIDHPVESWVKQELAELVEREAEKDRKIEEVLNQRRQLLNRVSPVRFPIGPPPPPPSMTVGEALDRWLAVLSASAKPSSLVSLTSYVKKFKSMHGVVTNGPEVVLTADMPVDALTAGKVEEVYLYYTKLPDLDGGSKQKEFMHFRSFVGYLAEKEIIPSPSNLRSKRFKFKVQAKSKPAPDGKKIVAFLNTLPPRLKLYALLALNCSMNNVDIGSLKPAQVDWKKRTLTRKRVKTEDAPNVPTVTYKLWDVTYDLLKKEKSAGVTLLTDDNGEPLYVSEKRASGPYHYDRIKSQWRDYFKKKKGQKKFTLQQFRFFGADLLKDSDFRSYRQAFLGHAPDSVQDKYYSSNEDVSKPCEYLERLLFPK